MSVPDLYLIRDFVPDFDAIAAEFGTRSRAMSSVARMRTDVPYGTGAREKLDLIFPQNPAKDAPLHVFVHGGYWRSGAKEDYRFVATPALAAGAVVALVEYDLMPAKRLPILVDQVRRAVLWLEQNARQFGVDPQRITVSGHSAGAHLSSYLAASGFREAAPPALPSINGLLLLSGIYDLSGIPDSFLRNEARMTAAEADDWSPLTSDQLPVPNRIVVYGEDETRPFHEQAKSLHALLGNLNQRSQLMESPSQNHMSIVLELGDPQSTLGRALADLAVSRSSSGDRMAPDARC